MKQLKQGLSQAVFAAVLGMLVAALCIPVFALDVTVTAASVASSSGATKAYGVAGEAITIGQAVGIDSSSGLIKKTDCNGTQSSFAGIAVTGASASGQPITYVTKDPNFAVGGTTTLGSVYVTSQTAGGIAPVADNLPTATPAATGCIATVIGVGKTSTTITLDPVSANVAIP